MNHSMNRRTCLAVLAAAVARPALPAAEAEGQVMTVLGPVPPGEMGVTLTHEHVLVDFIGADQASRDRYDADEAFQTALPHLEAVKKLGCETLIECTPAYIGRDPRLLKRLSEASGMRILTNTGYYGAAGDKFVPAHAYDESDEQLARRWIAEWKDGIEGTGIRPGFVKIGVDGGPLSEIDAKLVRAGAMAHLETGLTVASHTGGGAQGLEQVEILKNLGVHPSAWIWVHAQNDNNVDRLLTGAREGAWISLDGISPQSMDNHLSKLKGFKENGLLGRVLLSHDAGWYSVGEPGGGGFRPFTTLFEDFIPRLRENGFTEGEIDGLVRVNPREAFQIRKRPLSPASMRSVETGVGH